jgi:hypothetical protein
VSADGRRLLTGDDDGLVRLWDVATGQVVRDLVGHRDTIWCVALSADGRQALSGDADGQVRLWQTATGGVRLLAPHQKDTLAVALAPDGRRAVSASVTRAMRRYDLETDLKPQPFPPHPTGVIAVAFSPDGRRVASASGWRPMRKRGVQPAGFDYHVRLWDVEGLRPLAISEDFPDAQERVVFTPDGRGLVCCGGEGVYLLAIPE